MQFHELIAKLSLVHHELKTQALRAVNTSLTMRNWCFGYYIVEFEQQGKDRAGYGDRLLAEISKAISGLQIPNTNERELRRYRQFYLVYPEISQFLGNTGSFRGLLPPVSPSAGNIRGTASPESDIIQSHVSRLCQQLSYSHFVELIRIQDPNQRLFYEVESMKGGWSVKELKRQTGSLLYERSGMAGQKNALQHLVQTDAMPAGITEVIRDPYVFEFLGLKPREILKEKELEQALLDHLTNFLLELGKGFCFEARQKRMMIDNEHHFVDMVFYHRVLHCHVLVELKTERFHYSHAGQLNLYLEYFKKYEMTPGDNPPVGILLCTDKDSEHVAFATAGMDDKLFVAQYMVALPGKEDLEKFIKTEWRELKA